MKRLLLFLPLLLAACSGQPKNLQEQYRQAIIDNSARDKVCVDEWDRADFKSSRSGTYGDLHISIVYEKGRKKIVQTSESNALADCTMEVIGYLDEKYYSTSTYCDELSDRGKYPDSHYAKCYATIEDGDIVIYADFMNSITRSVYAKLMPTKKSLPGEAQ